MTLDDWLNAGYKRYEIPSYSEAYKLADFFLQKCLTDDVGKKYHITVYVYDRSRYPDYPEHYTEQYGFMPVGHFSLAGIDSPFFEVSMNGTFTNEECESWFDKLWVVFGKPYYREYEK